MTVSSVAKLVCSRDRKRKLAFFLRTKLPPIKMPDPTASNTPITLYEAGELSEAVLAAAEAVEDIVAAAEDDMAKRERR